jgi:hypothetical protein
MPGRITAEGTAHNVSAGGQVVTFDLRLVPSGLERGVPVEVVGRRGRVAAPVAEGDLVRVTGTWASRWVRARSVQSLSGNRELLGRRSA